MTGREASRGRTFGFLDHLALWGSLGITLYVMPFGSLLVPALSIGQAFLAVLAAAFIAAVLVAAVAAVAAHRGLSAVQLLGEVFGERSAPLFAALLLARNLLWASFALALIADSAELVSERALGPGLRPLWVLAFGAVGLALAAAGPQFTVRVLLRRAGLWIALLLAAGITLSAYMEFGIPTLLRRPAVGGWPSFWQGVDVMLVVPLLWLPLVADYARLGKSAGTAFGGSFAGLLVATAWMGFLGVLYLPAVETGDIPGFVVGTQLGLGALVLLLILQSDELLVNLHSAGTALVGIVPLGQRERAVTLAAAAAALALPFDLLDGEGGFLLLASLFVPLFGVVLAHHLTGQEGADPGPAAVAWALGFLLYHWVSPADVGWWQDALRWLLADRLGLPFPLTEELTWLGAAIPSFLLAFAAYLAGRAVRVSLRRPAPLRP